jgi:DNA-binding transcriptional MerR regulator
MDNLKENSKYKSIGEVARLLNLVNKKKGSLSTYTIRFWEKEFKQIKPKVFSGQRRYYDDDTINILKKIKYLLKDRGMTLNGVKRLLNSDNSNIDESHNTSINQKKIIKSKLKNIKKIINNIKKDHG